MTDFKLALLHFEVYAETMENVYDDDENTVRDIRHALRIADKLQSQEVSENFLEVVRKSLPVNDIYGTDSEDALDTFKAVATQIIQECKEGN